MRKASYDEEFLRKAYSHRILTREEEQSLLERISRGEKEAADSLVEHNLRFVIQYARKLSRAVGKPDIVLDLVNAGAMQLYRASQKYNIELSKSRNKGEPVKFITYAYRFLKQKMRKEVSLLNRVVVPKNQRDYGRYRAAVRSLQEEGLEVTLNNLEGRLDMSERMLEAFFEFDRRGQSSLDQPLGLEGEGRLEDITPDLKVSGQPDFLEVEKLKRHVSGLMPLHRKVIEMRYLNKEIKTLEEAGKILKLTRERVRQIEAIALKHLRRSMSSKEDYVVVRTSRGYRDWSKMDPAEYYQHFHKGLKRKELQKKDKYLYNVLRSRGLLNVVPSRVRDWAGVDLVKYYKAKYGGVTRGALQKRDYPLYDALSKAGLLQNVPIKEVRRISGTNPLEYYRLHYSGVIRSKLQSLNNNLYQVLRKKGLLSHVPLSDLRTDWRNVNPRKYYEENHPGLTRLEVLGRDPRFYNFLQRRGLLDILPLKVRKKKFGEDALEFYRRNHPGFTRGELAKVNRGLYERLRDDGLLSEVPKKPQSPWREDPMKYYEENLAGMSRSELNVKHHGLYELMRKKGLLHKIPTRRNREY